MFDFLRNIRKSAAEKRQEQVNAYLDGELSPRELEQFEQELAQDPALRAEVDDLRQIQMSMRQLPRVRAPRNYTLDPAVYGQLAQETSWQLYPALRLATALTAFFFILALALDLMTPAGALGEPVAGLMAPMAGDVQETTADTAAEGERAMEEMAVEEAEEPAAEQVAPLEADAPEEGAAETAESMAEEIEVTRVVTEEVEVAEEEAPEEEAQEPAAEEPAAEEPDTATVESAPAPGAAQADEAEARGTATAEVAAGTDAADGDAAAMAPPPEGTPADDTMALTEPTSPLPTPDPDEAADTEQDAAEPLPWLLLAEIVLGVGLVGLAVLTLIARRGA